MARNGRIVFNVVTRSESITSAINRAYLRVDDWDDWFKFSTMYDLILYDEKGNRHDIGSVKIGQTDMKENQRRPELPSAFRALDDRFFSLGQGEEYYEKLAGLSANLKDQIVRGLRDVVADIELWEKIKSQVVTEVSLTRNVSRKSIKGQYRRLLNGGVRLTEYKFRFAPPTRKSATPPEKPLDFHVKPESNPPTNIHVLIGRNGVGKTRMLHLMTKSLVAKKRAAAQSGKFTWKDEMEMIESESPFSSLVNVSFSAFDETELIPERTSVSSELKYYYIGLRRNSGGEPSHGRPKTTSTLTKEFVSSVMFCMKGPRLIRWRRALEMLESDPIFADSGVIRLADLKTQEELTQQSQELFKRLSSGHKIVLLTISRLVEVVEEKTLVLIDEPEAHLHPPLLSAFVRSLSDLLINRNGVAIIATHSPVVLQEVPRTCVWMLHRSGYSTKADRPECETFGENVGVLTREVFRLEVTQTGFHRLLSDEVSKGYSFDKICELFNEELGAEARAILRALIANRKETSDKL